MWQRLKDAVDSRILEEQARQRVAAPGAPSKPNVNAARQRSTSRTISPSGRRRRRAESSVATMPTGKEPDPSEFEPEFVIGEEGDSAAVTPNRTGTPAQVSEALETAPSHSGNGSKGEDKEDNDQPSQEKVPERTMELPQDVQQKLKKLERLEPKYSALLSSYRIAHARNKFIEPFEAALRENTPLTSINDPSALIEYLNQSNLKTTMVMDELKRISTERDDLKKMLEEAVKESGEAEAELAKLRTADSKSSEKGEATSVAGKQGDGGDDFFSYEDELPRLQEEVQTYEKKLQAISEQNETLKKDLANAKENAERLSKNLEAATKELREAKSRAENAGAAPSDDLARHQGVIEDLKSQLATAKSEIALNMMAKEKQELDLYKLRGELQDGQTEHLQLERLRALQKETENKSAALNKLLEDLRTQLQEAQTEKSKLRDEIEVLRKELEMSKAEAGNEIPAVAVVNATSNGVGGPTGGKKKNKKKKKSGQVKADMETETSQDPEAGQVDSEARHSSAAELMLEITNLRSEIEKKDAAIDRLSKKIKDQEAMQEELDSLRDDLRDFGSEHVGVKDKLRETTAQKEGLQKTIGELEKELAELKVNSKASNGAVEKHNSLTKEFAELKMKADTLQGDLSAAQQLAASRFKDLSDLKEIMLKAQPELTSLRTEVAELRKSKVELAARNTEVRRLEAREKDLKAELARITAQLKEKDTEIRSLSGKIGDVTSQRHSVEETLRKAQRDLQRSQIERNEAVEAKERVSTDHVKTQKEFENARTRIKDFEQRVKQFEAEVSSLREEVSLKSAQYATAQGLLTSMQDQSQELSTQMKEVRERCDSLEEELADAHRLLSERSREGETMRRLLADNEGRAEKRVKEMRERMEVAMEERDRAEEQASTIGRKRTRELEELKNRVKDAERERTRAVEEKEELERSEREMRRRKEDLEKRTTASEEELADVRRAMSQLREALDETEKASRELDREKAELRKNLDETTAKLRTLQHSSKTMAEELKALQKRSATALEKASSSPSARSSLESSRPASRLGSPSTFGPQRRLGSIAGTSVGEGQGPGQKQEVDMAYLKNVLLQFLEQRDKRHQMQLIPVLGMLLGFDKKDESRWMGVVAAR